MKINLQIVKPVRRMVKNVLTEIDERTNSFIRREKGASAVEYAILIALIATAIFLTITAFGVQVLLLFQNIAEAFPGV